MLHPLEPAEAYRRVELDAWIAGSDQRQLTRVCLAEAVASLGRALAWDEKGDDDRRDMALLRGMSATQALLLGVDRSQPLGPALFTVYGEAGKRLTAALRRFDRLVVASVRQDLSDIEEAFAAV